MKKIIFICVIFLIGCEKESIELESPNLLKKYQYEIKKNSTSNPKKFRLGKRTFRISKILKTKKPKV
jgi:hypothetical protein